MDTESTTGSGSNRGRDEANPGLRQMYTERENHQSYIQNACGLIGQHVSVEALLTFGSGLEFTGDALYAF